MTTAVFVAVPVAAMAQGSPVALATQTSSERGVSIKVSPKAPAPGTSRWEFGITLDTHSGDLSDDLTQSASVHTGDGRSFKPVGWTGSPPGGHHRQGVLSFDLAAPPPDALELRIVRPGESTPRSFRWKL